jgi:hypothetical protein
MKKTNRFLLLLLSSVTLLNISCKKDKTTSSCTLTDANFEGSYKIGTIKYKLSSSAPEVDGTSYLKACTLDDVTTFNTNHTFTYTDAGTKCNPAGDNTGTWSISGTTLTVNTDSEPISNFSCSGFTLSQSNVNVTGDLLTVTFVKQ